MTDRKHPSVAFWITVALVAVLVGYPLSFGPACWISSHTNRGMRAINIIYQPLMRVWWRGAAPYQHDLLQRYAHLWTNREKLWIVWINSARDSYVWQGCDSSCIADFD